MSADRRVLTVARVVAPAGVLVYMLLGAALSDRETGAAMLGVLVGAAMAVVLSAAPVRGWPLTLGLTAIGAICFVTSWGVPSNLGFFTICILVAWSALTGPPLQAILLGGSATVLFVIQAGVFPDGGWGAWIGGTVFTLVACVMARRQRLLIAQLRAAQAELDAQARQQERTRIARELHDVIGHALTVSVLHVTAARLALDEDPDEARASLVEAERLARESLGEVRAVVGLMQGHDVDPVAPLPGADQLDELVASFQRAGTPVEYDSSGPVPSLSASLGLTLYRIVQESLTNVVRHAPQTPASVHIDVDEAHVRVRVDSAGAPAANAREGTGVRGMRGRVEALGGELRAGPHEQGWRVEGVLPL